MWPPDYQNSSLYKSIEVLKKQQKKLNFTEKNKIIFIWCQHDVHMLLSWCSAGLNRYRLWF